MKENPFIPKQKGRLAIIDGRVSNEIVNSLEEIGLKVVKTKKCLKVGESIAYHPDIVIHPLSRDTLIVEESLYDYYKYQLRNYNFKLIKGENTLSKSYPNDIAYNIGRLEGVAIHNFKYTDKLLLKDLKAGNVNLLNVKQGYSKCSLMVVGDRSAITSDVVIHKKLCILGYRVLLIQPGYINLPGEEYGFIGGCSGNLSPNQILLSGRLDNHPDMNKILDFIKEEDKEVIYLSTSGIIDLGTIMVF